MASNLRIFALQWATGLWICVLFVMQNYLTDVWKLSFTHAAAILNIWGGISRMLPLFFLFLVDGFLGNFWILTLSGIAYTVGMGLLTLSTPPVLANLTDTCKQYEHQCIARPQKALFYTGMALVAVGTASQQVSLKPFMDEQHDRAKLDACNLLKSPVIAILGLTPAIGIFTFPYIKQWSLLFGISTICMAFATCLFLSGWLAYDRAYPPGSPLTVLFRVLVAAAFKRSQPFPPDFQRRMHRAHEEKIVSFPHTRFLRFMEKAAIILPDVGPEEQVKNRWRLCSIQEVEYAKFFVRMVPMWITFITCGIVSSIGNTYFVEQGSNMNRKLGQWRVPSQVLLVVFFLGKKIFSWSAERILNAFRVKGPPVGIAVSMIFSILCCITAAVVERRRLNVIRSHGLVDKPDEAIPMSAYWLFFQFFLLAGLDSVFETSVAKFISDQAPQSLKYYLSLFRNAMVGLGFMCGVLSVHVVGRKTSWFKDTLNASRLDRYYWVLAVLSSVNLLVFVVVASFRYRDWEFLPESEPESELYDEEKRCSCFG